MAMLRSAIRKMCELNAVIYSDRLAVLLIRGEGIRLGTYRQMKIRNGNELVIVPAERCCPWCGVVVDACNPVQGRGCYRCTAAEDDEWL